MKFFWPIYFLSAAVGTAGVYMAAPLARPYVEAVFGKRHVARSEAQEGGTVLKTVDPSPSLEAEEPDPTRAVKPAGNEDGDGSAPAMNGIFLALSKDKPSWGITCQRTTTFGLDGKRMGHVPGGVLLEYRGARVASIGNMVECVLLENGTHSPPRLVSKKEVCLFTGSYTKLSAHQRAALQTYYEFNGKIDLRKAELLQEAAAKNPFFATYNQAYQAYMSHIEAAKALTAKRTRATGQEKFRIEDQLREMKMAETKLRLEYDAIHAKFRLWKDQHPNEIAKAENDPDVQKWAQEMNALRPSIPGLAP